jgi:hypothetical protein
VQFRDLGRTRAEPLSAATNHIGRYPLHLHHLLGAVNPTNSGYQFVVVGNAISDSRKWPIAVHGSHFGLVRQNVVYGGSQLTGSGIAIEDGTETENLFEENFVVNIPRQRQSSRKRTEHRRRHHTWICGGVLLGGRLQQPLRQQRGGELS